MILSEATTRGASDLHRLEAAFPNLSGVICDSAADVVDDFAQSCTERNFNQTRVGHMSGEGECFGAGRVFGADALEDFGTDIENPGNMRQRFNVVDNRRLAP